MDNSYTEEHKSRSSITIKIKDQCQEGIVFSKQVLRTPSKEKINAKNIIRSKAFCEVLK
jgi:hypothetical protein